MRNFKKDKVFIIAEAGPNHNGDLNMAYELVEKAKEAGVDAIKFQTSKPEKHISKYSKMAKYQIHNTGKETSMIEMSRKFALPFDSYNLIKKYCDDIGIMFLSTPFHIEATEYLNDIVSIYKIPSGEIINYPYLRHMAEKNKPIILSTGMSTLSEVEKAIEVIKSVNKNIDLSLLHCTTNYPCPYEEVNLQAMITLKEAFKLPVGYSDHTLGIEVPIAAVAMGARIIEKHFTLDRTLPGPDHKASLEPNELKQMVESIRNIEKSIGDGLKKPNRSELEVMKVARKSLVVNKNIEVGQVLTFEDVEVKRPADGLKPEFLEVIIGKRLVRSKEEDQPLQWEDFFQE